MVLSPLIAAALLAAASFMPAGAPSAASSALTNAVFVSSASRAGSAASVVPERGQEAPDFVYQSHEHLWQNLHNMLEENHVLLVFGASDEELGSIEADREPLQALGIAPVAVVTTRDSDARRTVRQLNLGYSLLADPRGAIGEQYGVRESAVVKDRAMWFVIDQSGAIRDKGEGLRPESGWRALASQVLNEPMPTGATAGE